MLSGQPAANKIVNKHDMQAYRVRIVDKLFYRCLGPFLLSLFFHLNDPLWTDFYCPVRYKNLSWHSKTIYRMSCQRHLVEKKRQETKVPREKVGSTFLYARCLALTR